jgi:ABC-type multidrug transport system ATPase subunit
MVLRLSNISKTYPTGVHALKSVSLTIPRGMYGLLGPNGAGKSPLMRILATLQDADAGRTMLGETDVLRDGGVRQRRRRDREADGRVGADRRLRRQ